MHCFNFEEECGTVINENSRNPNPKGITYKFPAHLDKWHICHNVGMLKHSFTLIYAFFIDESFLNCQQNAKLTLDYQV